MILTKGEILSRMRRKEVLITPFKKGNVKEASVDLTLGNEFRVFKGSRRIMVGENAEVSRLTVLKKGVIELRPFDFVLGITKERIKLPGNLVGLLTTRSRFARLGLSVSLNSPLVQPGVDNKQVLEIFNASRNTLVLKPGLRICQLFLFEAKGHAKYLGKFKGQLRL